MKVKTTDHGGIKNRKPSGDLRSTWFALVVLQTTWLCFSGCTEESTKVSQVEPQLNMHRVQAGVIDSKGWYVGESTGGHFQVKFPATFNDFTISGTDTNGEPFTS